MSRLLAAVLFVWAGTLFGVAFVATPAKFLAPSLSLAEALDVGRWTFHVLAFIEWGLVFGVAGLLSWPVKVRVRSRRVTWMCVAGVLGVLIIQTFGLRPILDARVLEIFAGRPVPSSPWHALYVGLEGVKLMLLVTAGTILTAVTPNQQGAATPQHATTPHLS